MNAEIKTDTWTVAEAKARLSEVIEKARRLGPQAITRNGKDAVVVVDASEWKRVSKRQRNGTFTDFLSASPLHGSGMETTRLAGGIREPEL